MRALCRNWLGFCSSLLPCEALIRRRGLLISDQQRICETGQSRPIERNTSSRDATLTHTITTRDNYSDEVYSFRTRPLLINHALTSETGILYAITPQQLSNYGDAEVNPTNTISTAA